MGVAKRMAPHGRVADAAHGVGWTLASSDVAARCMGAARRSTVALAHSALFRSSTGQQRLAYVPACDLSCDCTVFLVGSFRYSSKGKAGRGARLSMYNDGAHGSAWGIANAFSYGVVPDVSVDRPIARHSADRRSTARWLGDVGAGRLGLSSCGTGVGGTLAGGHRDSGAYANART